MRNKLLPLYCQPGIIPHNILNLAVMIPTIFYVIAWNTGSNRCPNILFTGTKEECVNHMECNLLSEYYGDELVPHGHDFSGYSYSNSTAIHTIMGTIES